MFTLSLHTCCRQLVRDLGLETVVNGLQIIVSEFKVPQARRRWENQIPTITQEAASERQRQHGKFCQS